ncbi:MAG: PEP-utilizing enzyme [Methanobacterium sp.]|nr:PEP-utilizing enzyme [Methanobacterium sp.]
MKIVNSSDFTDLKGKIIIVSRASCDIVSYLYNVADVITDYDTITSHVAIVSREMSIPSVVGTENGTQVLEEDMFVTVNGNTIYGIYGD